MSKIIGVNMFQMSDFKMLDRKVINELLKFNEKDIFFRALSSWVGFKTTQVEFEVAERLQGESKWSIKLLIKYAINNITSFSTLPLQMITILGGIYLASTLGVLAWHLFNNWDNLFLLLIILILFTGGVLMLGLGVIGYYLSKIYIEIKDRPRYIITETI